MAKPRVFVSSTYYDLKHIRASLENFIESLGFEAILSEKGHIAYAPDRALDESCYREVNNADVFVIIIGARYGSEKSEGRTEAPKEFFDRYESITKQEYKAAIDKDIPIYILIEKPVYSEYETFLNNRDNKTIVYAHVNSVNVFHLIEDILNKPRNNPVQQFDRYSEIESWLKEQWAGLFRELLNRTSSQNQLSSLASQVSTLSEISTTLKKYLEELVSEQLPEKSEELIQKETKRLSTSMDLHKISSDPFGRYLNGRGINSETIRKILINSKSVKECVEALDNNSDSGGFAFDTILNTLQSFPDARRDLNDLRKSLNLEPFDYSEIMSDSVKDLPVKPIKSPKPSKPTESKVKKNPPKRTKAKKEAEI